LPRWAGRLNSGSFQHFIAPSSPPPVGALPRGVSGCGICVVSIERPGSPQTPAKDRPSNVSSADAIDQKPYARSLRETGKVTSAIIWSLVRPQPHVNITCRTLVCCLSGSAQTKCMDSKQSGHTGGRTSLEDSSSRFGRTGPGLSLRLPTQHYLSKVKQSLILDVPNHLAIVNSGAPLHLDSRRLVV